MYKLFIELLRMSLGTYNTLSRLPSEAEWGALFLQSQRQCVTSLMICGLERIPADQKPSQTVLLEWIGVSQIIATTYALQCRRAKELTEYFQQVGCKSCVLKGVGFSQLYPFPAQRQGGDIDLWVDGERKRIMNWLTNQCPVEHIFWHHVEAKFFKDVETEIHFHPCWMYNPFYNNRLQKWFEIKRKGQMVLDNKLGFAYPTIQFNAVYSLIHFYHHLIEEGVGIRHVVDYFYIMKALPAEDRVGVFNDLKRLGLLGLSKAVMWVLKEVCGMSDEYLICEPNEKEGGFLLDEIMRGGNFGKYRTDNRRRNTVARMTALLPHYPSEVLWVVPWKVWHWCWRKVNILVV